MIKLRNHNRYIQYFLILALLSSATISVASAGEGTTTYTVNIGYMDEGPVDLNMIPGIEPMTITKNVDTSNLVITVEVPKTGNFGLNDAMWLYLDYNNDYITDAVIIWFGQPDAWIYAAPVCEDCYSLLPDWMSAQRDGNVFTVTMPKEGPDSPFTGTDFRFYVFVSNDFDIGDDEAIMLLPFPEILDSDPSVDSYLFMEDSLIGGIPENQDPTIDPLDPQDVFEGEQVFFTGWFSDPDSGDVHTASADWGDGVVESLTVFEDGGFGFYTGGHVYGDDGEYTVSVTLADGQGGSISETMLVSVNNLPPAVDLLPVLSVDVNTPLTVSGSATDPGSDDLEFTFNWGDGSPATVLTHLNDGVSSDPYPSPDGVYPFTAEDTVTHTYTLAGEYTLALTVLDDDGLSATVYQTVTVNGLSPVAEFTWAPEPQSEGSPVAFTDASTAGSGMLTSWAWDFGDGATSAEQNPVHVYSDEGAYTVTLSVEDAAAGDTVTHTVNILNAAPAAEAGSDQTGDEGDAFTFTGSAADPGSLDTLTAEWSFGDGATQAGTLTPEHVYGDNGVYTVTLTISDGVATAVDTLTVTVNNVAPTPGEINGPIDPLEISLGVTLEAPFTDPGFLDTHTAEWDWGDGQVTAGTVTETDGQGAASGGHLYGEPGVYTVTLTVTDDDGDSGTSIFQYVVVYDTAEGFVTGGGWIDSPLGAYTLDPTLTGKATFGFVSKYKKGATVPTGNTQFVFHADMLNFHSSDYDWLVIAGEKAKYKGTGAINGLGEYGFMLTATDGDLKDTFDTFRIKIWDKATGEVVYDNQMGESDDSYDATQLSSGNIKVHKK